jgi:hypothetical protein
VRRGLGSPGHSPAHPRIPLTHPCIHPPLRAMGPAVAHLASVPSDFCPVSLHVSSRLCFAFSHFALLDFLFVERARTAGLSSCPHSAPAPLRPATQDEQNTVHRFWVSGGGIGGGTLVLGSRLSAKGTRPSYQNFSGNGVAGASMCADLHQYRPVVAIEGGAGKGRYRPRNGSYG